jgi:hypothetical protein
MNMLGAPKYTVNIPLQLFQDHRDGNLEASGMTMARNLHQAVPSSFQVIVPVGNI